MPANMMKAPVGSSKLKVIGSSSAMVSAGPIPGSTPTNVPSSTPIAANARFSGVRTVPKPSIRSEMTARVVTSEDRRQPGRQRHAQVLGERREEPEAEHEPGDRVAHDRPRAEHARENEEHDRGGQRIADRLDRERVDEERQHQQPGRRPVGRVVLRRRPLSQFDVGPPPGPREEQRGQQDQPDRHDQRDEAGPARAVAASPGDRCDRDEDPDGPGQQDEPCQPGPGPGLPHPVSPMSSRTPLTRVFSDFRKLSKSSPVLKKSVHSFFSSICFHSAESCSFFIAAIAASRSASSMSGGATTPRQFVISTSRPWSLSVLTCLPATSIGSAVETASTRILPASTWSAHSEMAEMPASTEPERMLCCASPPPE